MKFEYQEKIDSYVHGDMTAEERTAFEHEVQSNEELRDQLEYTKQVKTLVSSRQEKMALMQQWEAENATRKPASKKRYYWLSGIAAVLIIGFFAVNPLILFSPSDSSEGQFRGGDNVFVPGDTLDADSIISDSIKP